MTHPLMFNTLPGDTQLPVENAFSVTRQGTVLNSKCRDVLYLTSGPVITGLLQTKGMSRRHYKNKGLHCSFLNPKP